MNALDWKNLRQQIRDASEDHHRNSHPCVAEAMADFGTRYERRIEEFLQILGGRLAREPAVAGVLAHLRRYLGWLRWTAWNTLQLSSLVAQDATRSRERLALATLAYAAGRLVDDGLDQHAWFKGHQATLVGFLTAEPPGLSKATACSLSAFAGFCAFAHAQRAASRGGESGLAALVGSAFARIQSGALAEPLLTGDVRPGVYRQVIRRKAVAYNMILYRAFLADLAGSDRFRLLRVLFRMDELAQWVNDFVDVTEDGADDRFNAFTRGAGNFEAFPEQGRRAVAALWRRLQQLGHRQRTPLAAMLNSLDWQALDHPSPEALGAKSRAVQRQDQVWQAVRSGLRYLSVAQMLTGEFPAYHSPHVELWAPRYHGSPFFAAMILLALTNLQGTTVELVRSRGLRYLAQSRARDGTVAYFREGITADLDDTCLVNWLLQTYGADAFPYRDLAQRIRGMRRRGGLFPTWLGRAEGEPNEIDACVSVNVLRFLQRNDLAPFETWAALRAALRKPAIWAGTLYYAPALSLPYLLGTLEGGTGEALLGGATWAKRVAGVLEQALAEGPRRVAELAMGVFLSHTVPLPPAIVRASIRALLALQQADGSWPICALFRAYDYWGSPSLTTALAVQALGSVAAPAGADAQPRR